MSGSLRDQNREISRLAVEALMAGNVPALLTFQSEDVVVHVAGRGPLAGDHVGSSALAELIERRDGLLDGPPVIQPHDIVAGDDHVVVLLDVRLRRDGRDIDARQIIVAHIRDGKIREAWVEYFEQAEVDALWSAADGRV